MTRARRGGLVNWKDEMKGFAGGLGAGGEGGRVGGDVSLREDSLARSLLAQPDNPCKDNNQRDYQEMSRNGKTRRKS